MSPCASYAQTIAVCSMTLVTVGCATTVSYQALKPARVYTHGIQSLAVVSLDGPDGAKERATDAVREELAKTKQFRLTDDVQLQRVAPEPLRDSSGSLKRHVALEAARRLRLDGLLVGQVQTYDSRTENTIRAGSPVAGARISYELIELPAGHVRDANHFQHFVPASIADHRPETIHECAHQLAEGFVPHQERVECRLAQHGWSWSMERHRAIRAAKRGDWQTAEDIWTTVLTSHPQDHAVLHDLGVAHEAMGNYAAATELFRRASEVEGDDRYQKALERVAHLTEDHLTATDQLRRRHWRIGRLPTP